MVSTDQLKESKIVALSDLSPHPSNYRGHPEEQIHDLMASLVRFGPTRSIVVQEGPTGYLTVAGHGVVEAAKRVGLHFLRADIIPADWTPEQVKGYLISDNLHAQKAVDDEEQLARLLQEQKSAGYDLATLGTDEETLRQMLEAATLAEQDEQNGHHEEEDKGTLLALLNVTIADPLHTVHPGEVYALDQHRLLCVHVFKEWALWSQYLVGDTCLFLPFAGPLVALSERAESHTLVMVQPDPYIAGHILDRYAEIHGEPSIRLLRQFEREEEESDEE